MLKDIRIKWDTASVTPQRWTLAESDKLGTEDFKVTTYAWDIFKISVKIWWVHFYLETWSHKQKPMDNICTLRGLQALTAQNCKGP